MSSTPRTTIARSISASLHGRYLVDAPVGPGPFPILAGFHGYAEDASIHLERLRAIPGSSRYLLVSIQGLHRFYRRRTREVVSSWMTQQDRELMIADNVAYVWNVIDSVRQEWRSTALVFCGFSQGVATAFRAACLSRSRVDGLIALGGDVPPDLGVEALERIPAVLLGRGDSDEWYTESKWVSDEARLATAGIRLDLCRVQGGHDWTPAFSGAAGDFLGRFL